MRPIHVALVGAGSMAAHHARAIARSKQFVLNTVIDRDLLRARVLAAEHGKVATADLKAAFECEAAIVATATAAHCDTALAMIEAGVHVLVEKPLTSTLAESRRVIDAADRRDAVIMCGLVERFNPAFLTVQATHDPSVTHIGVTRVGRPPDHVHSGVVDDVLIHDLDLVLLLADLDRVVGLQVHAEDYVRHPDWPETITCRLQFESGLRASLRASRVASVRQRCFEVSRGSDVRYFDVLGHGGDPLGGQLARFAWLIRHGSGRDRATERRSLLPGHELADRIEAMVMDALCSP